MSENSRRSDNDSHDGHQIDLRNRTSCARFLKKTVKSDLMWFFIRYAHPGDGRGRQGTRHYEYSTVPSVTLGTLRKW